VASHSPEIDRGPPNFVLVHSPLVGPASWRAVAGVLRDRGLLAVVPDLPRAEATGRPFWEQQSEAVVRTLEEIPIDRRLILVGHSGAGALLPAIGHATPHAIAAYLFVDAGIPANGQSRLENGPFADFIHQLYASGQRYPNWTDDDLRELIPDDAQRRELLDDLRPPPLAFWEEPLAVFPGWPDAPCGFLRFAPNPAYDAAATEARQRGWPVEELEGGHFHLMADPVAVAIALIELAARLGVPTA
jgi:hypothetical protein